jgi:outer membrane protein
VSGKRLVYRCACAALALGAAVPARAFDMPDVLRAQRAISATAAGSMIRSADGCPAGPPGRPLRLSEAVERALCANPKTREAWADVKAQAAAVGVARAAYLPTVSASWQGVRESSIVDIENQPSLSSDYAATVRSESITLNWLLFDFGGREMVLKNAGALLEAARATQDATLQAVFAVAAKDYFAAQAAIGALDAARDIERVTKESMVAAQARVDRGIAPILDALQAQTQHAQAVFRLTKAEGDAQKALGTIASDMGLNPDVRLDVPAVDGRGAFAKTFSETVAQMIDAVRRSHPSVRAAEAQYEAALAKVSRTRAQGLPNLSLVAKYSRNNQPQSLGLGLPNFPARGHDAYIGVQVSIPLFEGFGRQYQIDQARAEAERQQDVLDETRQQVALDVWTSWHALTTATQNVTNSMSLLDIARQAYEAARHRYDAGVGNILELMNTQAALAGAQQQRIQALADWNNARISLASKLGRLDAADIH